MVAKRSEYQNQFKSSVAKKQHDIYRENLVLRTERRDREFMHTPLCWGELEPEDEALPSDNSEEEARPSSKAKPESEQDRTVYQSLAEIMAESRDKAEALRRQRFLEKSKPVEVPSVQKMSLEDVVDDEDDDVNKKQDEKEVADKSISIHDLVEKENRKLNQKIAQAYVLDKDQDLFINFASEEEELEKGKLEEKNLSDLKEKESNLRKKSSGKKRSSKKLSVPLSNKTKTLGKEKSKISGPVKAQPVLSSGVPALSVASRTSKRPERPDRQSRMSRTKQRPASACSSQSQIKPPFVAYGAADVEDSLALHRTHNVLCPSGVYGPALRAKMLREEEQRRHREKMRAAQLRASTGDLLDRLSAASLTPRDLWASEYSRQFHGYEPAEYQRAVSVRSVLPRVSSTVPTLPFRTGGCKVVHVD